MAFKMKGSAFKLGNVATKSVLKQKTDPGYIPKKRTKKEVSEAIPKDKDDTASKVGQGPLPMKSALKQTKFTDKLKAFGTAITSRHGLMTPGNAAIKKAYSKYKSEKKKYRAADRKSKMNK